MRKAVKIACNRIQDLAEALEVPAQISALVTSAFVDLVLLHPEILKGRHIDQMIVCTLYGVCRVNKVDMTYRKILERYRTQPQANSRIYKEVQLLKAGEKGDIIKFYNLVYVPLLDNMIMQFDLSKPQIANNLPLLSPSHHLTMHTLTMPVVSSPSKNINVVRSPTKQLLATNTPAVSKIAEFNFGESPSKSLQAINSTVSKARTRKRLFNDPVSIDNLN